MKQSWIIRFRHDAVKRAVAGLLLLLWLGVLAAALLPHFHADCHADAHSPAHQCAVTALEQGKFIGQTSVMVFAAAPQVIPLETARLTSVLLPAISHRLAPDALLRRPDSPTVSYPWLVRVAEIFRFLGCNRRGSVWTPPKI